MTKLSSWLVARAGQQTEVEMMRLWKGLFYCMWMCDKRPVQHELARNLASIADRFEALPPALLYIHCFFMTMEREWPLIDKLRYCKRRGEKGAAHHKNGRRQLHIR